MARNIDVFGFDELEKAMKQCEKNYPSQADAFLMAEGRAVNKRTKSLTPVRTKKLLNSWRTKKVKLYKDGKVRSSESSVNSTSCTSYRTRSQDCKRRQNSGKRQKT